MLEISEALRLLLLRQPLYKRGRFTSTETFGEAIYIFTGKTVGYSLKDDFLVIEVESLTATNDGQPHKLPYTQHTFSARLDAAYFVPTKDNCFEITVSGIGTFCFYPNPALSN